MRIYTDASTRKYLSGIAFVATDQRDRELYKRGIVIEEDNNNTAELCAILFALEDIQYLELKHVTIFTDSLYAINTIKNGSPSKKEQQIIKNIRHHMKNINSDLMWVKGHYRSGTWLSYYNKRADKMAKVVRRQHEKLIRKIKRIQRQQIFKDRFSR